jgi:hypothetical protein
MLTDAELAAWRERLIADLLPKADILALHGITARGFYVVLANHPEIRRIRIGQTLFVDPLAFATARGRFRRGRQQQKQQIDQLPPPRKRGRPRKANGVRTALVAAPVPTRPRVRVRLDD